MKNKVIFLYFLIAILFYSCEKIAVNKIRVNNKFPTPLDVIIGSVQFYDVQSGEITEYKTIAEGQYDLSGDVDGPISIPIAKELQYWTLIIEENGEIKQLIPD